MDTPTHFHITLTDGTTETICGADVYSHEQQMTVFYRSNNHRGAIDCWSTPLASIRTADINIVRRDQPPDERSAQQPAAICGWMSPSG